MYYLNASVIFNIGLLLKNQRNIWILFPLAGIILFIILYIVATFYYPGGSQADKNSIGFSWMNNYWCNLLNEEAINGDRNSAQPIALIGMCILCLALSFFWFVFPTYAFGRKWYGTVIRVSGILAMVIALLLFTHINHDVVTNLASLFGLIAMVGTLAGLSKMKWYMLFFWGLLNLLLVAVNNYVYYNNELIVYLPFIQKLSFVIFLSWVGCINLNLYRRFSNA